MQALVANARIFDCLRLLIGIEYRYLCVQFFTHGAIEGCGIGCIAIHLQLQPGKSESRLIIQFGAAIGW